MKKNYMKPSLLSETFVAENIMTGEENKERLISTNITLYLNGEDFAGINFTDAQTLNAISFKSFNQ